MKLLHTLSQPIREEYLSSLGYKFMVLTDPPLGYPPVFLTSIVIRYVVIWFLKKKQNEEKRTKHLPDQAADIRST